MKVFQFGVVCAGMILLAGCSTLGADGKSIDYGSAASQARTLEVPPDLTVPTADERYKMPQESGTAANFSEYNKGGVSISQGAVLPEVQGVTLERNAAQRWLSIKDTPENVWHIVKSFWTENGLSIKSDDPRAGVMETNWAENKARFPEINRYDVVSDTLDDKVYSEGERDMYITRLERGKEGKSTEVYITHRGMEEVFSNDKKVSQWQARGSDPEKVAIMLQRMMERFGLSHDKAAAALAASSKSSPLSPDGSVAINTEPAGTVSLREVSPGTVVIVMNDPYDRSWRKVGLAIGSSGLSVEDKDREKGVYYLRQVELEKSWWDRIKFWSSDPEKDKHYRVIVKDAGTTCEVSVIDQEGASNKVTRQIVETIYKNLNQ